MTQISDAPEYVYQGYGRKKLVQRRKAGLISPPGSGKTRMILAALRELGCNTNLIICSGSAVAQWKRQIPLWYGNANVTVMGQGEFKKPQKRIALWAKIGRGEYKGFVIINYALYRQDAMHIYGRLAWKARHWDAVVSDEYHKAFRGHKTQTFKKFRTLARAVPVVIPTSGTALGKHPGTLWTLFHICDPVMFGSYWKFVKTFCLVDDDSDLGPRILGPRPSTQEQLKALMDRYFAYIPDDVVADQLPEGKRMTFDVEMSTLQERHYTELVDTMVTVFDDGEATISPNTLAQYATLKKLLCCPKMVHAGLDFGGGFEAICDTLEEQSHVIIFVPFRDAVDIYVNELRRRGWDAIGLYGGVTEEEQAARLKYFKATRGILVCTIQYAESFDCETCDTSYFLGYIPMLDQHTQAEGRTRRAISTHKFVKWYYVCYAGTIDEQALSNIGQSLHNIEKILSRPQAFINALKGITMEIQE